MVSPVRSSSDAPNTTVRPADAIRLSDRTKALENRHGLAGLADSARGRLGKGLATTAPQLSTRLVMPLLVRGLRRGAQAGREDDVARYGAAGARADVLSSHGDNALHRAAKNGHAVVVDDLLRANPAEDFPNLTTRDGRTALRLAFESARDHNVETAPVIEVLARDRRTRIEDADLQYAPDEWSYAEHLAEIARDNADGSGTTSTPMNPAVWDGTYGRGQRAREALVAAINRTSE